MKIDWNKEIKFSNIKIVKTVRNKPLLVMIIFLSLISFFLKINNFKLINENIDKNKELTNKKFLIANLELENKKLLQNLGSARSQINKAKPIIPYVSTNIQLNNIKYTDFRINFFDDKNEIKYPEQLRNLIINNYEYIECTPEYNIPHEGDLVENKEAFYYRTLHGKEYVYDKKASDITKSLEYPEDITRCVDTSNSRDIIIYTKPMEEEDWTPKCM